MEEAEIPTNSKGEMRLDETKSDEVEIHSPSSVLEASDLIPSLQEVSCHNKQEDESPSPKTSPKNETLDISLSVNSLSEPNSLFGAKPKKYLKPLCIEEKYFDSGSYNKHSNLEREENYSNPSISYASDRTTLLSAIPSSYNQNYGSLLPIQASFNNEIPKSTSSCTFSNTNEDKSQDPKTPFSGTKEKELTFSLCCSSPGDICNIKEESICNKKEISLSSKENIKMLQIKHSENSEKDSLSTIENLFSGILVEKMSENYKIRDEPLKSNMSLMNEPLVHYMCMGDEPMVTKMSSMDETLAHYKSVKDEPMATKMSVRDERLVSKMSRREETKFHVPDHFSQLFRRKTMFFSDLAEQELQSPSSSNDNNSPSFYSDWEYYAEDEDLERFCLREMVESKRMRGLKVEILNNESKISSEEKSNSVAGLVISDASCGTPTSKIALKLAEPTENTSIEAATSSSNTSTLNEHDLLMEIKNFFMGNPIGDEITSINYVLSSRYFTDEFAQQHGLTMNATEVVPITNELEDIGMEIQSCKPESYLKRFGELLERRPFSVLMTVLKFYLSSFNTYSY